MVSNHTVHCIATGVFQNLQKNTEATVTLSPVQESSPGHTIFVKFNKQIKEWKPRLGPQNRQKLDDVFELFSTRSQVRFMNVKFVHNFATVKLISLKFISKREVRESIWKTNETNERRKRLKLRKPNDTDRFSAIERMVRPSTCRTRQSSPLYSLFLASLSTSFFIDRNSPVFLQPNNVQSDVARPLFFPSTPSFRQHWRHLIGYDLYL